MKNSTYWIALLFSLLLLNGCAAQLYTFSKDAKKTVTIQNADFDTAYSKALRVAADLGYKPFTSDKAGGTFTASRGDGMFSIADLTFSLDRESNGTLSSIVTVKSSKGSEGDLEEFLGAYGKQVKLVAQ